MEHYDPIIFAGFMPRVTEDIRSRSRIQYLRDVVLRHGSGEWGGRPH